MRIVARAEMPEEGVMKMVQASKRQSWKNKKMQTRAAFRALARGVVGRTSRRGSNALSFRGAGGALANPESRTTIQSPG